jgi:transposase-like protein
MANELERAELIQEVAALAMQGYSQADIARQKGIAASTVRVYLREWESYIKTKASDNPELFDKVLENSLRFIENYDMMLKNAWEVHDESKDAGVPATRLSSLKLIQEITAQKARFYQLLGPRTETNYLEKAKRAERVNEVLSEILRDTVADCDRCSNLAWDKLREAFQMMERPFEDQGALVSGETEEG